MTNVVGIYGNSPIAAAQPQPELIAFIERLLDVAKSGHLQHLAAVWIDKTGFVGDGYAPGAAPEDLIPLIGGMEVAKFSMLSKLNLVATDNS